jgi:hypothetical protein
MLAFLLINNVVLTGVMFTPSGRGVTHAFVDKNLSTGVMFTPYGRGVTQAFVDKTSRLRDASYVYSLWKGCDSTITYMLVVFVVFSLNYSSCTV